MEKHASLSAARYSREWAEALNGELRDSADLQLYSYKALKDSPAARERDHLAHYILR